MSRSANICFVSTLGPSTADAASKPQVRRISVALVWRSWFGVHALTPAFSAARLDGPALRVRGVAIAGAATGPRLAVGAAPVSGILFLVPCGPLYEVTRVIECLANLGRAFNVQVDPV